MTAPEANLRRPRLAPDRCVLGLLALEGFLLLSAWFRWFAFNQHKGWTVLIAMAASGAGLTPDVPLVSRRLAFSAAVPVQHPLVAPAGGGRRRPVQLAGDGNEAGEGAAGTGERDSEGRWVRSSMTISSIGSAIMTPDAQPPGPAWLRKLLGDDLLVDVSGVDVWDSQDSRDAEIERLGRFGGLQDLDLAAPRSATPGWNTSRD